VRKQTAEVQWNGRSVILSRQIFPVFERLLDKALSRDQVASGSHVEGTTAREAKDLIRELRGAFRTAGFTDAESKDLIVTVRNRGYQLGVPEAMIIVDG
jgi:DNA-binding response OmpR family regulator